jgi:hypothetical protein
MYSARSSTMYRPRTVAGGDVMRFEIANRTPRQFPPASHSKGSEAQRYEAVGVWWAHGFSVVKKTQPIGSAGVFCRFSLALTLHYRAACQKHCRRTANGARTDALIDAATRGADGAHRIRA